MEVAGLDAFGDAGDQSGNDDSDFRRVDQLVFLGCEAADPPEPSVGGKVFLVSGPDQVWPLTQFFSVSFL